MAVDANALTTLAAVKQYAKITTSTFDAELERMIDAVTFFIENVACRGRQFNERTSVTELHDGKGKSDLFTKHRPITTVNTVHDDNTQAFGASTLIAATDYRVKNDEGIIQLIGGLQFQNFFQNVQIDYDHGYSTIPQEVADVAIEMVAMKHRDQENKQLSRKSERFADGAIVFFERDLIPQHKAVLDLYRYPVVGGI